MHVSMESLCLESLKPTYLGGWCAMLPNINQKKQS
jgi:hypothetical protein